MPASPPLPAALLVGADRSVRACTWEEVAGGLQAPDGGYLWVLLDGRESGHMDWLRGNAGIDPVALRALGRPNGRAAAHPFDDALMLSLRGINLNEGADPEDMVTARNWLEARRVLTVRHDRIRALEDVVASFEQEGPPRDVAELILRLATRLTTRISDTVEDLTRRTDRIEDQVLSDGDDPDGKELNALRHSVVLYRRQLAAQRDALHALIGGDAPAFVTTQRRALRDLGHRMARHVDELETLRERAQLFAEEVQHRDDQRMNQRMYVFTILAGVFLPLGFLTGLLGINVGGMPGADDPYAFWWVAGACVLFGIGTFLYLRLNRWL